MVDPIGLMNRPETRLKVVERELDKLKPSERNARTHSDKQISQIAASIDQFGFTNPLLVDSDGRVVAGHGRLAAAKLLGLEAVPTIALEHLGEKELRAYALADNKLALNAGWDPDILKQEFELLSGMDLKFDLEITGFSTTEIDLTIDGNARPQKADPLDALPDDAANSFVTSCKGDLWALGSHRLLCGDSREAASFALLMGADRARMVFSDPPYNVRVDGHVCGMGAIKHEEFAMASGEMSEAEFIAFLKLAFRNAAEVSIDGAIHYQCMDWRHVWEMMAAGRDVYSDLKNVCVWAKDNGGMGSFYRSQHELVFVWKVGSAAHLNTVELGKNGRYRTNVWSYAGANSMKVNRLEELAMHPTVKPVAMIMDALKDASRRGDIVLDPFGGSGSTLIAAEKSARAARLIEYEGRYCDVAIRRWQSLSGKAAVHDDTGETFEEVTKRRARTACDERANAALECGEGV